MNLKPCPYCGGEARRYEGKIDAHGVVCNKCGAKIYGYASAGAATRAWNRRTTDEELEFTRKFIVEKGLLNELLNKWKTRKVERMV